MIFSGFCIYDIFVGKYLNFTTFNVIRELVSLHEKHIIDVFFF